MQSQLQTIYSDYAAQLPGQQLPWLKALREQAFSQFTQQGIPTIRSEAWKYTNLHRIANQNYTFSIAANTNIPSLENIPVFSNNMRLVFVDGWFIPHLSTQDFSAGVNYQSLALASRQQTSLLSTHLQQYRVEATSAFSALNISLALDGAVLQIAENANVGVIELVYYGTKQASSTLIQPRNLIVCSANSRATIVEHYVGEEGANNLTNAVTEVDLGPGAQLQHIKIQTESAQTDHIGQLFVKQQENSYLKSVVLSYGGNIVRNEIQSLFAAPHSKTELFGLFIPQRNQHMDQYTLIDHHAPFCTSEELYRGILLDNARGVFNGRVIVQQHAHKSNAKQVNNNLLLSATAEIDTKPELQIYNDDVQCMHAVTIGQLDQQALFYMRARGLALEEAKGLLLQAFAAEVLEKVCESDLKAKLYQQLFNFLPNTFASPPQGERPPREARG